MGAKKGGKKAEESGVSRQTVASNYIKVCKGIGISTNPKILELLRGNDDDQGPLVQLILSNHTGKIGPGCIRAIADGVLGVGSNFNSGPYTALQTVRLWECPVGDEGMFALANILEKGGDAVKISFLEVMECNIGIEGCRALGNALNGTIPSSLLTLKLNCNKDIGSEGCAILCRSLFTNSTLKQLHLDYCHIDADGGVVLGQLLCMPTCMLNTLSIKGNALGTGLKSFAAGLKRSKSIVNLNIADNIAGKNYESVFEFANAIVATKTLTTIDFTSNALTEEHGELLLETLAPCADRLITFLVDSTLSVELFTKLNRQQTSGKKKGKKGGKKSKKK